MTAQTGSVTGFISRREEHVVVLRSRRASPPGAYTIMGLTENKLK